MCKWNSFPKSIGARRTVRSLNTEHTQVTTQGKKDYQGRLERLVADEKERKAGQ